MRRVRLIIIMLAMSVIIAVFAAAPVQTQPVAASQLASDRNERLSAAPTRVTAALDARTSRIFDKVLAKQAADRNRAAATGLAPKGATRPLAVGDLCAVAVLPGPADSVNIRIGIFNVAASSVAHTIMDSFHALGGRSLLHESVFGTAASVGGTLTVEYPTAAPGKGPVVLSYTSFDTFESVSFSTDPDTYDNPAFGATVRDMDDTVLELVYSGDLRCAGTLKFDPALNSSIAFITQTSPTP